LGPNYTHFKNKKFDMIYESTFLEANDSIRNEMYKKLDKIIIDEAPIVVLFYDEAIRFVRTNVTNLGSNPINLLNLKRVKKSQ
jgi:peptide/nickel transport system substrate-binding protein